MKINLNTRILSIRGKPIKQQDIDEEGNPKLDKAQKPIMREVTVRDYLLTILGSRFKVKDKKEVFWTTDLGIRIANEKNKEIEIAPGQVKFLKRLVENNKATSSQQTPMGIVEKEVELFFPYELGQLLKLFGELEEEIDEVEALREEVKQLKKEK